MISVRNGRSGPDLCQEGPFGVTTQPRRANTSRNNFISVEPQTVRMATKTFGAPSDSASQLRLPARKCHLVLSLQNSISITANNNVPYILQTRNIKALQLRYRRCIANATRFKLGREHLISSKCRRQLACIAVDGRRLPSKPQDITAVSMR